MKKITRHYSQTLYLFVIYGSFILVLLGIFFTYTYSHYRENTLEESKRSLENMCASITNSVEVQLDSLSTISMNIVYSNMVKTNFREFSSAFQRTGKDQAEIVSSRQSAEVIHDIVTAMIGAYQSASYIRLYDMDGSCVESGYWMSTSRADLESLAWYDEVMELNGFKYISEPKTRKDLPATGKNRNSQKFISLIRLFLNRDGAPEGIAEVAQDCGKIFVLASQLEDSNPDIRVQIYNSRKELVYPYTAFDMYGSESYHNLIEKNEITDGISQIIKNSSGQNMLATCETMVKYGWNVVLLQSESSIYRSLEAFQKMFLRISALSILLTLLICFYISRRFTVPLQKLTAATKKITIDRVLDEKKVNLTSADSSIRELSILCNSVRGMYDKLRSTSREVLLLRNEETRAKLQATQSLINPHFLYNSLTNISAMAEEDMNDDIVKICEALCIHFRYISASGEMIVPLGKELEKSRSYLECMQLRFTEELEYTFDVPDVVREVPVPKLIAQPVLENAFKYAFVCRPPWKLSIAARLDGEHWKLTIEDNVGTMTDEKKQELLRLYKNLDLNDELKSMKIGGMGLKNVYLRLRLLYGKDAVFCIENREGAYTRFILGGNIHPKKGIALPESADEPEECL
ncbi:histidine kinase [Schaedlerella sp.]|uniref:sensor histidine kinase n=1 Tax=Schaedlerella sp. TaxID=2676057 RepID=UPI00136456F1|nr:HAMP domain-containing protein [Lachnospiraceae bacterium]